MERVSRVRGAAPGPRSPARTRPLITALTKYLHVAPLVEGRVSPETTSLEFSRLPNSIVEVFRAMSRSHAYDLSELGLSTAFIASVYDAGMSAIPVFATRRFDVRDIYFNRAAGVSEGSELEGQRVAVRSPYVTDTVWALGFLADHCGVDLRRVTWVVTQDEHVRQAVLPDNVQLRIGADIAELLETGEVAGMVGRYHGTLATVEPVFPEPEVIEQALMRQFGAITVHHVMVIADRALQASDERLPDDLYAAFCLAKEEFLTQLGEGQDVLAGYGDSLHGTWHDYGVTKTEELARPDPMPYGLIRNTSLLQTYLRYCKLIGMVPSSVEVGDLFLEVAENGRS